jgi:hypothetical protein
VALLLQRNPTPGRGFALALMSAASALLVGVAAFGWLVRRYPLGIAATATAMVGRSG